MTTKLSLVAVLVLTFGLATASPAVLVDGVNDFLPSMLIDSDGGDTEFAEIDLGEVYVTNDATNLYIGYEHDHGGWGAVQVGIALGTIGSQGGDSDPWDRRIDFLGQSLPDYVAYKNIDSDYDDLIVWDTVGGWQYSTYDLDWVVGTGFDEVAIPLAQIAAECPAFHQIYFEIWITQDSCSKGPLDLSYNDAVQLSTVGGTTWELNCDGTEDVILACYHCYLIDCPVGIEETSWGGIKGLYW